MLTLGAVLATKCSLREPCIITLKKVVGFHHTARMQAYRYRHHALMAVDYEC